jgi:hypothetical protein
MIQKKSWQGISILLALVFTNSFAGNTVEKIYDPYVQQLENELEYELVIQNDNRTKFDQQRRHKFSYGQAINDRWLLEFGVSGTNSSTNSGTNSSEQNFDITAYEFEAKYQLSEQGEFNNDWGLLFEIERETDTDIWEFGSTLIVLHDWKKWTGTANITLAYETGPTIDDELETELATQLRYRHKASFEPGIEYFKSQSTNALGPSFSGQFKFGGGKNLFWSTAALFSFDSSKPDNMVRFNIEYEF